MTTKGCWLTRNDCVKRSTYFLILAVGRGKSITIIYDKKHFFFHGDGERRDGKDGRERIVVGRHFMAPSLMKGRDDSSIKYV